MRVDHINLLVLDEADKLMNKSFLEDIDVIYNHLLESTQIIASSATYPVELDEVLRKYLSSPTYVSSESETSLLLGLKLFVSIVKTNSNVLTEVKVKTEELIRVLSNIPFKQCLVFSNYQTRAESLSNVLNRNGWNSTYISAAMKQSERIATLVSLKEFKCRILLTTDLTARGIDIASLDLVINFDVPYDTSTYLHRMGRAGRYGSKGICVSIVAEGEELNNFQNMIAEIGGVSLTVNKLSSKSIPENIWEAPASAFEQVAGVLLKETPDLKHQNEIHSSVIELKQYTKPSKTKVITTQEITNEPMITESSTDESYTSNESSVENAAMKSSTDDSLENVLCGTANEISDRVKSFNKNIALLGVTELLATNVAAGKAEETIKPISDLLEMEQAEEKDILKKNFEIIKNADAADILKNIDQFIDKVNLEDNVKPAKEFHENRSAALKSVALQNVFQIALDHAIDSSAVHWGACIKQKSVAPNGFFDDFENKTIHTEKSRKAKKYSKREQTNRSTIYKKKRQVSRENCGRTDDNHHGDCSDLPFLHNNYVDIFNQHKEKLLENMNTFNNTASFDSFFNYWKTQVKSSTDYVQQNIHLEEMNKYQYYKYGWTSQEYGSK